MNGELIKIKEILTKEPEVPSSFGDVACLRVEDALQYIESQDETIILNKEQAKEIRILLWELNGIKDNLLYHTYSPESLKAELNKIENAINWLEA